MKFNIFSIILFLISCGNSSSDKETIVPDPQTGGPYIYVSDAGNFQNPPWKILRYDLDGKNPKTFINSNIAWPQDILFLDDQNIVLISNLSSNRITKYNAQTGIYIGEFAVGISGPTRMKIGPDSLLYVLQWNSDYKVKRYQLDGTSLGDYTSVGVNSSIGIDWDSIGNLYVSSFFNATVRKFDSLGVDQGLFISDNLVGPTNIQFLQNGHLLVLDYSGAAVKEFDENGDYLGVFASGLGQTEGIAILSSNGNFLIGNGNSSSVKQFNATGDYINDLISNGSGGLIKPNAVVIH